LVSNKKRLLSITIWLVVLLLLSGTAVTLADPAPEEKEPDYKAAPLNPLFEEYTELMEEGKLDPQADRFTTGYIPSPVERQDYDELVIDREEVDPASNLPSSFDLREENRVTPVKDQGGYGSCWAFATYGSLESYLMPDEEKNFSENNLMRSHGFDMDPMQGGNELVSMAYLSRWDGPVLEKDDPYPYGPGDEDLPAARHVQNVEFIPKDKDTIKQTIKEDGAVAAWMYADMDYYDDSNNAYYYDETDDPESPNHMINIIGWDDHYSKENFKTTPEDDGAWIIKDSHGPEAHDDGYFYISYEDTWSAYYATAFHNAEPTDNYSSLYYYDEFGLVTNIGAGTETLYGANIFTAENDEALAAVSIASFASHTDYEIEIYTGVEEGEPTGGSQQHTQKGTFENGGYRTIPLTETIPLSQGERFSVVIEFTTPGFNFPVPMERKLEGHSSKADNNPGESFISPDKVSWDDLYYLGQANPDYEVWKNVCIKAFTTEKEEEDLEYTIEVSAKPEEGGEVDGGGVYEEGETVTVTATANEGYYFVNWTEDGNEVSTESEYTFEAERDRSLTANFRAEYTNILFFQNPEERKVKVWYLDGHKKIDKETIAEDHASGWLVKAVYDMNNSGYPDLVWQHPDSGELTIWQMIDFDFNRAPDIPILNPASGKSEIDPVWEMMAVHDLNDSGNPDIFWQRDDGELAVWLQKDDGSYQTGRLYNRYERGEKSVSPDWQIGAVFDLLADGDTEVIWHAVGGEHEDQLAYWKLDLEDEDAFKRSASARLINRPPEDPGIDPAWSLRASADLFGTGKEDLIFQRNDGELAYWTMDGLTRDESGRLEPKKVESSDWQLVGSWVKHKPPEPPEKEFKDGIWHGIKKGTNIIYTEMHIKDNTITAEGSPLKANGNPISLWVHFPYEEDPVTYIFDGDLPVSPDEVFELYFEGGDGADFALFGELLPGNIIDGLAVHQDPVRNREMEYNWIGLHEDEVEVQYLEINELLDPDVMIEATEE